MKPGTFLVCVCGAWISCCVTSDTSMPIVAAFIAPTRMPAPVLWGHDSSTHCCREFRPIPARWNHLADRGVLGGESPRKRRGLVEKVDMSRTVMEQAGFTVTTVKANHEYRFLSRSAQNATRDYSVHSLSLLAIRN